MDLGSIGQKEGGSRSFPALPTNVQMAPLAALQLLLLLLLLPPLLAGGSEGGGEGNATLLLGGCVDGAALSVPRLGEGADGWRVRRCGTDGRWQREERCADAACAGGGGSSEAADEQHSRMALALVLGMLGVAMILGELARWSFLPHSSCSLLIGVAAGWLINRVGGPGEGGVLQFSDEFFFLILLPPIIFESGFNMDHLQTKAFLRNVGPVIWFAFAGTFLSCVVTALVVYTVGVAGAATFGPEKNSAFTGLESLVFGALIAATDPVTVLSVFGSQANPNLDVFSLIFGESVLNDAIAIILYGALDTLRDEPGAARGEATPQDFRHFEVVLAICSTVYLFCAALMIGLCSGM